MFLAFAEAIYALACAKDNFSKWLSPTVNLENLNGVSEELWKIVPTLGKTNSCGVAIGFVGIKALNISNIKRVNLGCVLVIEVKIDDSIFVLINIYNANTEPEQQHTLNNLINILETFKDIQSKGVVLGGDFNVILKPSLDSEGVKPVIKKKTTKLI